VPHPIPRLFDADAYTVVDHHADTVVPKYLLPYPANTRHSYESNLKLWFRWCADHGVAVLEAERWHIELYDRQVEASGLKPSTRQRKIVAIRGYYQYAEQDGVIARSPATHVRRPRVPQMSESGWLQRYEIGPFLAAADARGPHQAALCCLLVMNGLRVGEAVGADVDGLAVAGAHRTLTVMRKGGRTAEVPLAPRTFRTVMLAVGERTDGPLLLDQLGKRMTRHTAGRVVRLVAARAGITRKIGPHALRHTYITQALDAGVPVVDGVQTLPRRRLSAAAAHHPADAAG
jgi:integrase/recombinase XerD